jgi:multidrug transporter EmrE-like cation transporter
MMGILCFGVPLTPWRGIGIILILVALLKTVRNRWLWLYVAGLQVFSLFAAYVLLYWGMNALANAGIGAVAYPLLVGSCIIGFSIYSLVILREKGSYQQYFALTACICGIIAVCIK